MLIEWKKMQSTKIKQKLFKYSKLNEKLQKTNLCKFGAKKIANGNIALQKLKK